MNHYIQKVCPVILRQREEHWQILAFRHPLAGAQLIKGTLEADERPEVGVLRELAEESGIEQATVVEKIGEIDVHEWEQHWYLYWCRPAVELPEQWSHFTTDGGGLFFQFFWHPLTAVPDGSWREQYRQALAFIHTWQQGRRL